MIKKIFVLSLCLLCLGFIQAQSIKKKNYSFHSINSVALLNGDNGVSEAIQTVNGFSKGSWFAGIGLGLDYYQYRTVPLFADVRYEYGKKRNKVFAYADAGINFSWVSEEFMLTPTEWNGNRGNSFNNGLYTDAGIGLSAGFKNGNAFILSLGISHKTLTEEISYNDWQTGKPQVDVNIYRFNRVVLKTGYRF